MIISRTALALAIGASAAAHAATVPETAHMLIADYALVSSTSAPGTKWVYTKARIKARRLDAQHLVLFLSCEWGQWPRDACHDWWVVRQRPDGLYLQDLNTGGMSVRFDPATRTLSMTMEGAQDDVRTDLFRADPAARPDPMLERRMKRAESSFAATVAEPAFGKPARWDFTRQRIYPGAAPASAQNAR